MTGRSPLEQQAMALAGVAQAARLVDQVSRTGSYPEFALQPVIDSLFRFDAGTVDEIYGGPVGVKLGLQTLDAVLANQPLEDGRQVVNYVFALLHLERKFARRSDMLAVMRSRLEHAHYKSEHFAGHVEEVCHSLSGIYQDTLSTLKFRIQVRGNEQHLRDERNADIIRAALLGGVRSAFLWRQLGGRRYKLLWQRGKLRNVAQNLSRELGVV